MLNIQMRLVRRIDLCLGTEFERRFSSSHCERKVIALRNITPGLGFCRSFEMPYCSSKSDTLTGSRERAETCSSWLLIGCSRTNLFRVVSYLLSTTVQYIAP
jgi:hypothetical protein